MTGNLTDTKYSPMSKKGDKPAKTIYDKIKNDLGISRTFLKKYILPEWWDDEILESGSGRQEFQLYLLGNLGISLDGWKGNRKLTFGDLSHVEFKKQSNQDTKKFQISIQSSISIARKVLNSMNHKQLIPDSAEDVRNWISKKPNQLQSTLEYFQTIGIPIIPIWGLPSTISKPTAMVFKVDGKYAIAIGRKTNSPCMQIFNLFHELGHIVSGHLTDSASTIVDVSIEKDTDDEKETEANRFAVEVFTGNPNFETHLYIGRNAKEFAEICKLESKRSHVDPSFLALNLAWANPKEKKTLWPLANSTLKFLEKESSLPAIRQSFLRYVNEEETPEDYVKYLDKLTQV